MYTVYALVDPRTAVIRYVGITNNTERRKKEHLDGYRKRWRGRNSYYNNWQKYLRSKNKLPIFAILGQYSNLNDGNSAEREWIAAARAAGIPLVNWEDGGISYNGTRKVTWGASISKAKKGKSRKSQSRESIEKTAAFHRGRKRSIETRQRQAAAQMRNGNSTRITSQNKSAKQRALCSASMSSRWAAYKDGTGPHPVKGTYLSILESG